MEIYEEEASEQEFIYLKNEKTKAFVYRIACKGVRYGKFCIKGKCAF